MSSAPSAIGPRSSEQIEGAPTYNLYATIILPNKIDKLFVQAILPFNEFGKVISLKFHLRDSIPIHQLKKAEKENPYDCCILLSTVTSGNTEGINLTDLISKVKQVLITFETPSFKNSTEERASALAMESIARLCVTVFLNMSTRDSAFIWHRELERINCDKYLLNAQNLDN